MGRDKPKVGRGRVGLGCRVGRVLWDGVEWGGVGREEREEPEEQEGRKQKINKDHQEVTAASRGVLLP